MPIAGRSSLCVRGKRGAGCRHPPPHPALAQRFRRASALLPVHNCYATLLCIFWPLHAALHGVCALRFPQVWRTCTSLPAQANETTGYTGIPVPHCPPPLVCELKGMQYTSSVSRSLLCTVSARRLYAACVAGVAAPTWPHTCRASTAVAPIICAALRVQVV